MSIQKFLPYLCFCEYPSAQHNIFSSSSLVFILKMNVINYCEAKPLALSDWMMTFFHQNDGLSLYQQLTGLNLPPAHNPGRVSLGYTINYLIFNSADLPIKFPPYLHKSQQTHAFFTIIINLSLPISHMQSFLFVVWNHVNYGWFYFHWMHIFLYSRKCALAHRLCEV